MSKVVFAVLAVYAMAASASALGAKLGGSAETSVADPDVLAAANFVLASANTNECSGLCAGLSKEAGPLKLVKVVSASQQIVAGINYTLELLMADATGKQVLVTSTVWSRPWLAAKNSATDPATQITKLSYKVLDGTEA